MNHCQLVKMAVPTADSEDFSALLLFTKFPLRFFVMVLHNTGSLTTFMPTRVTTSQTG